MQLEALASQWKAAKTDDERIEVTEEHCCRVLIFLKKACLDCDPAEEGMSTEPDGPKPKPVKRTTDGHNKSDKTRSPINKKHGSNPTISQFLLLPFQNEETKKNWLNV
ncbi:hypothetical protein Ciccas_013564 [Cichlidogyrus casuarinus]|uniref:Uncharacterized protein n=1 Tax=Cichlidogyrus casuarinus TaxID=1844966 RepID=A0ABD2PQA5_9PLAT